MKKSEVLQDLTEELGLTKAETEQLLNSFLDGLTHLLSTEKGFTLPGLGSFSVELRPSHTSFNPYYKKKMTIPDKKVVKFRQSSVIRDELNGTENE